MRALAPFRRQLLMAAALGPVLARAQDRPTMTLGVVPNVSPRLLVATYQPLRQWLEARLAQPVQVLTAPDFASFHQRCAQGHYPGYITTPNLGALAQADADARVLGVFEPGIAALAVAPRGRVDQALTNLRGRKLALANPASLVALRGLAWLQGLGLQAGRDFDVVRAPNEDSLARWLDTGDAPLALMSGGEFSQLSEPRRQLLAVVQQVAMLPGFFAMCPAQQAADDAERWQQALAGFLADPVSHGFRQATGLRGLRPLSRADQAELAPLIDATRQALATVR